MENKLALVPVASPSAEILPTSLFAPTPKAAERAAEFFTAQINNPHTRKAYLNATRRFAAWCAGKGIDQLAAVRPIHVAAFLEELRAEVAAPTVKQHLAAIRVFFDWLVVGHVLDANPAHSVRGPKHVVKKGKTPVLTGEEARLLLDSIDIESLVGLRDRALIGLMTYSFARVGAVLKMQVRDYFVQGRRGHVRLHEKGGKEHEVPCHHELEEFLDQYISIAGIGEDLTGPLFRTSTGRSDKLNAKRMYQQDVFRMIRRRAARAGIETLIGNHTFRATGITAYLKNGGSLEMAQHIANHESPRTTKLYDRRVEEISQNEVEKIRL